MLASRGVAAILAAMLDLEIVPSTRPRSDRKSLQRARLSHLFLLLGAVLLSALSAACSAAPDAPGTSSGTTTTTAGNGGQGGDGAGGAGQGGDIINPGDEIVVVPSNPIVMLDLPLTQTVPFECVDTLTDEPVAATWKLSSSALGTIASDGVFTPNGKQTGDVVVECETQNGAASTTLKVLFNIVEGDEALTQAEKDALLGPQGLEDASWKMLYPYPDTVFPRGILPPEIHMSTGSAGGDTYYVHILVPSFEYKGFFKGSATATQLAMSQVAWDALTQVAGGQKIVVEVAKLSGGTKYGPITRKWVLAKGKLHGVIHYESYDTQLTGSPGAILRIKGNSPMPEVLLDNCTVCHSVAADGSTIATASGTFDLTGGDVNPPNLWSGDSSFAALFPKNGSVIVTSYFNTPQLRTKAGETITGSGIEANTVESASFSLDGTRFAFWNSPLGAQNSVLGMLDYDEVAQKFTNFQVLANMTNVPVTTWPAFMPDGKTVVFQVGTTNMTAGGTGRLMAVDVATKQLTNLASLNGDGYLPAGPRDQDKNYEPTIAPIASGGYFWVTFTSRRTYGNKLTGPEEATKRLWIAAYDINSTPGVDASHPAFYLAGQELTAGNSRGFWSLDACKANGEGCQTADECCDGACNEVDPGSGELLCGEPQGCSNEFGICETDADCCEDLSLFCIGGKCSLKDPN